MAEENRIKEFLDMQRRRYQERASYAHMTKTGVLPPTDGVVGSYVLQEQFPYDENILKHFTKNQAESSILEYGCGPGRNLLRLAPRFKSLAGVDISDKNISNCKALFHFLNSHHHVSLYVTSGDNIPIYDRMFDMIFEVICFQHICSYTIRKRILTDMVRVCNPGGIIVCQMGFNNAMRNDHGTRYYVEYDSEPLPNLPDTNGASDCCVLKPEQLSNDFKGVGLDIVDIWYTDGVNDTNHDKWIWICGRKPS